MNLKNCLLRALFVLACSTSLSAHADYAWDLLKRPEFKSAYLKVLGPKASQSWIAKLLGPSEQATRTTIGGEEYIFANSCKPHACDTDNLAIAFGLVSKQVFVLLHEDSGTNVLFGAPPVAVKAEIEAYYLKSFVAR
ncbi:inhibitor of vertebrate lysozyme family protein [Paucibacter sp. TC2R-5]|uniref:inhibitor of vertebrate lysozyme family protein n=1 Tax=Paucibacter sp. TC2R-5 TaxID=2893555 RepID=UPI0021E48C0C|nr:inhibitor of vertebrate lysozyme family protein [Paucibacter sp. TC2R-5]MCV2360033.1 inhibitor of vertebrate lysozyme family protein [Paucibacter sp. TC2R-5]